MRALIRGNKIWFSCLLLLGLALRLLFVFRYPEVGGDTFVYGDLAKNLLHSHVLGRMNDGQLIPSYVRLPGYPAFLAMIFAIAGNDHYNAVMFTQTGIDLLTCFLIAGTALAMSGERAAKIAFLLAALCPFTANFCAAPLTETLAIFLTAGAIFSAIKMLKSSGTPAIGWCVACGIWNAAGILLRPDAPVLLASIWLYVAIYLWKHQGFSEAFRMSLLLGLVAIAPLIPWTVRNWRQFQRFQPLAPRYANNPDEFVPMGFNRWTKTWSADLVSVWEIFWKIEDEDIDVNNLPSRAFDTPAQRQLTAELFAEYNATDDHEISPELDAKFAALAQERIEHAPLRYYVWLPALRVASMWLRPRTEIGLPIEQRWWEYSRHSDETRFCIAWMFLNLIYVGTALVTVLWRVRVPFGGMLVLFIVLRSLMLANLENPEPRYTLECFPAVMLLSAAGLSRIRKKEIPPELKPVTTQSGGRSS